MQPVKSTQTTRNVRRSTLSVLALSVACGLTLTGIAAENAVILEDFENSIDSASLGDWGSGSGRIPDNVVLTQYTSTGPEDINVTHGNKSLEVALSGFEEWTLDFKILLSEEASLKVQEAMKATNDVARYILRYDIVFPGGNSWMNNQAFLGNVNDQLNTPSGANGGKATMSWALDLAAGVPEEGQITLRFADNFDATDEDPFVGPKKVYIDNIRLVDTYAPGAQPVTYVLQSFEDAANPTGGAADFTAWGGTPRTTYSRYTKDATMDPPDNKVSDGNHSLKVDYTGAADWKADFMLPFANTKLAEVLRLDLPAEERPTADQLARYTLRYDIIYPDQNDSGQPSWQVTQPFALDGSWPPYAQARRDGALGSIQTFSITLDQMTSWNDTAEGAPLLVFIEQGDWSDAATLYYDNFRLIDTGAVPTTQPVIQNISVNAQKKIVITWTGAGTLQWSPTLPATQWTAVTGAASGTPIDPPTGGQAFYRVAGQ